MSYVRSSFFSLVVLSGLLLLLSACDSSTGLIDSETEPDADVEAPSADAISSGQGNELSFSIDFHGDVAHSYQQGNTPLFDEIADDPSDLRGPDGEIEFTGSVGNDGLGSFSLANSSTQMLSSTAGSLYESDFSYSSSNVYRDFQGSTYSWNLDQDLHLHLDDDAPIRYSTARQDLIDAILLDSGDGGGDGGSGGGDDDCTTCIISEKSNSEIQRQFESQGYTVETVNTQDVKVSRSVGPRSASIEVVTTIDRQTGDVKGSVLKRNGNVESHFNVGTDAQGYPTLQSEMMTLRPGQNAFNRR